MEDIHYRRHRDLATALIALRGWKLTPNGRQRIVEASSVPDADALIWTIPAGHWSAFEDPDTGNCLGVMDIGRRRFWFIPHENPRQEGYRPLVDGSQVAKRN